MTPRGRSRGRLDKRIMKDVPVSLDVNATLEGVSGTNAHVVLQEAPASLAVSAVSSVDGVYLFFPRYQGGRCPLRMS